MKQWNEGEFDDLDELVFPAHALEPGQMIIWSHALSELADHIQYLIERAKYYGDLPGSQAYQETLQHIAERVSQIRKTSQGEA